MERDRVVVRRPPPMTAMLNDKLDQLQQMISEIKKKTSKFTPVTPWNKRPKVHITHPALKEKAS